MNRRQKVSIVLAATITALASLPVAQVRAGDGQTAGAPVPTAPVGTDSATQIALAHLDANRDTYGLSPAAVSELVVRDVVASQHNGLTNVYVQQRHSQIDIAGAIVNVAIDASGTVLNAASRLVAGAERRAGPSTPQISDTRAAQSAAAALGLQPTEPIVATQPSRGAERAGQLTGGGVSETPIPSRLVYVLQDDGTLRLAWELVIDETTGPGWWAIRIDAETAAELDRVDYVSDASYRVFAEPVEAPTFASPVNDQTDEVNPADATASPNGWHSNDLTTGNNVDAYTDTNDDNQPDAGSRPDGGAGRNFLFDFDPTLDPASNTDAAVVNLFYWNNHVHDVLHRYGFDEPAGNFQTNNFGRGGAGNDSVRAEAQDGSGVNNANFATPPDGQRPRMQMYVWDAPNPDRDSSFDNGVIAHEYAHGLSTRLTGGPSAADCLENFEQAGEGWSDFVGYMFTMRPNHLGHQARGIGTYVLGQPTTGDGIRRYPYSTDMTEDPRTYDEIKLADTATYQSGGAIGDGVPSPHAIGSVWGAMLWEMTFALLAKYPDASRDITNGSGGDNVAMQLVVDGLKLQPCTPGFVDARDAILLADQIDNGGVNRCTIWAAFAKRGLGASATQGDPNDWLDGVQAFDLPGECTLDVTVAASPPGAVLAGTTVTYTVTARNHHTSAVASASMTTQLSPALTVVAGSVSCGGTGAGQSVTFPLGTLAAGEARACTFVAKVATASWTTDVYADGFDGAVPSWTLSGWSVSAANPHSAPSSLFAANPASIADRRATSSAPFPVAANTVLRFWHDYYMESAWDGGVVEISTNGGATWTDLGAYMRTNGYDLVLNDFFPENPLRGRQAFSGTSEGYVETVVDLAAFAGTNAHVRFRLGSDSVFGAPGWYVDDLLVRNEVVAATTTTITGTGAGATPLTFQATTSGIVTGPPAVDYLPLAPARLLDSRQPNSTVDGLYAGMGVLGAGTVTEVQVAGRGGVPIDATATALNVTVVDPQAPGFATIFPCGQAVPIASNLNYLTGDVVPNAAIAKIGIDGKVCIYTDAATHLIVDTNGAFPL